MKSPSNEYPPSKENLPEKGDGVLNYIAERSISFRGHRMSINMDTLEDFVGSLESLTAWTKYVHIVSMLMKSLRFFPDAPVEGDGEIFDNN
jgi:hypothetical protein